MEELKRHKLRTDYGNKTGDKIRTEHYVSFNHDYVKYLEDELLKLLNIGDVICCGNLEKMSINWMKLEDGRKCMPHITGYNGTNYRVNNCPSCGKYIRDVIM